MILTGHKILELQESGELGLDPFEASRVNPVSVDVTLGQGVAIYEGTYTVAPSNGKPLDGSNLWPILDWGNFCVDSKRLLHIQRFSISDEGWILKPGICYLMCTAERIKTGSFVSVLDGKSSIGRLFIKIHETAGYIDTGWNGHVTLEVTCQFPVRVYAGMRIGQVRFHSVSGEVTNYHDKGNYPSDSVDEPTPSKAYKSAFDPEPAPEANACPDSYDIEGMTKVVNALKEERAARNAILNQKYYPSSKDLYRAADEARRKTDEALKELECSHSPAFPPLTDGEK